MLQCFLILLAPSLEKWKRGFLDCVMDRFVSSDNDIIGVFLILSSCNSINGPNKLQRPILLHSLVSSKSAIQDSHPKMGCQIL